MKSSKKKVDSKDKCNEKMSRCIAILDTVINNAVVEYLNLIDAHADIKFDAKEIRHLKIMLYCNLMSNVAAPSDPKDDNTYFEDVINVLKEILFNSRGDKAVTKIKTTHHGDDHDDTPIDTPYHEPAVAKKKTARPPKRWKL